MLKIDGLEAYYGESHILHNVDFQMAGGERVSVLGRNGAGKSTFLKSIMHVGVKTKGMMSFDGRDLAGIADYKRARLGMAMVPEDRRIFSHLSVIENLTIARYAAGERECLDLGDIMACFPMLEALSSRYGNQLSGGQQQVLAVARGIYPRPRILLLDEPTEGVAPVIVQQMAKSINEICGKYGIALLLCEQNIWFARTCTHRVCVIDSGHFVFDGSWAEFDADSSIRDRYLAV